VDEILLRVFALAVVLAVPLVAGRLGWCSILAVRAHKYHIAAYAAAGIVCIAVLLAAVLAVWFLLAVGHRQKDVGDTYAAMAVTGIPFFLASFGLWRLAGAFHSRLRSGVGEQSVPAKARAATRDSSQVAAVLLAAIAFSIAAPVIAAVLFLPVMLVAGPGSSMLPLPLAGMIWFAAIASVILVPAWLARLVYRWRRPAASSSP
jgi:hypothetical protein